MIEGKTNHSPRLFAITDKELLWWINKKDFIKINKCSIKSEKVKRLFSFIWLYFFPQIKGFVSKIITSKLLSSIFKTKKKENWCKRKSKIREEKKNDNCDFAIINYFSLQIKLEIELYTILLFD